VAGRLSVKLDRTVITNNVDLERRRRCCHGVEPHLRWHHRRHTKFTTARPWRLPRSPEVVRGRGAGGGAAAVEALACPTWVPPVPRKVTNRHVEEQTGPKLDEAAIVVSGGRGLGEADKYELVEDLAKLLKGAPGASRAIVDAGWVPYSLPGRPDRQGREADVYIAAGISGATQHMVGMKGSKNIIAINKDPKPRSSASPTWASWATCTRCFRS
jgi:electron transfer flavoprotein alpha subunit